MSDDGKPTVDTTPKSNDLAQQQQQTILQQQLHQQQLQLLQLQQQQLQSLSQNMSPSELAALQQQQLALFMMPMFPLMMPLQQQTMMTSSILPEMNTDTSVTASEETPTTSVEVTTNSDETGTTTTTVESEPTTSSLPQVGETSPTYHPSTVESLGLSSPFGAADGFGMLTGTNTVPLNMDEVPKRKRGRPPKKDVAARAKAEEEKTLKQQFPMWGYGLPMPLLPGFPGMLPGMSNPGAVVRDHGSSDDRLIKEENEDSDRPAKMAKKKQRGTGKPRGRPRTRPRPGEVMRRVKPLPIAPANYSVMYNYSLSNMAQKSAELNADGIVANTETTTISDGTQDENRLGPLSSSLLSGEHEEW
ncbi:unnamed protein product [Peronospora belbahrii]|uniref:Uncharacterized protein n=1 Tax=Peronospora belbahrii TaxID=622444 RepID=A0AAU9KJV3_9STRA|nr:unnamed protein product [Peronospora belbahrii]CAH0520721.1 unnamed protein product [Peronospora belbahrii]